MQRILPRRGHGVGPDGSCDEFGANGDLNFFKMNNIKVREKINNMK